MDGPTTEVGPGPGAPRGRRSRWRMLLVFLTLYLILLLVLFLAQDALIFPGRHSQGRAEASFIPLPPSEFVWLRTTGGQQIAALYGPALDPDGQVVRDNARPLTLLFFYGNGTSLEGTLGTFDMFRRLGVNVMVPEYLGYGLSEGRASEAGCYATADAAYQYLREQRGVDPRRIVASGFSLGGAVAIDLASRKPVGGLATFATFSSMTQMAGRQYPYLPTSLLLRHRFESETKIRKIQCPIFMAYGTTDTLIPTPMAEGLAAAAGGPVFRYPVEGAGHNDLFLMGDEDLLVAFARFLGGA